MTPAYQELLRGLMRRYPYRIETNYAKLDRIIHPKIEAFKQQVLEGEFHGLRVREWAGILASTNANFLAERLQTLLK